jgi:hypothetical protein
MKRKKIQTIQTKTISLSIKNKRSIKIFDRMTQFSKNIFNISLFCFNILKKNQDCIYKKFFKTLKNTTEIERKDKYNKIFSEIYNEYFKLHTDNMELINTNNKIIYEYIKNLLKDIVLTTLNYEEVKKNIITELSLILEFNNLNKKMVFLNIVNDILKSFYLKNYYKIKYELANHHKISIDSDNLIEEVKRSFLIQKLQNIKRKLVNLWK